MEAVLNVVNGFLEGGLEEAFGNRAWETVGWARNVEVLIGALTPGDVFFLWVPLPESVLVIAVLHLLRDEGDVGALNHHPFDSDVTELGHIEIALVVMRQSGVNIFVVHLCRSPSLAFKSVVDGTSNAIHVSVDGHMTEVVKLGDLGSGNSVGTKSNVVVLNSLCLKWPACWVLTVLLDLEGGRVVFRTAPALSVDLSGLSLIVRLVGLLLFNPLVDLNFPSELYEALLAQAELLVVDCLFSREGTVGMNEFVVVLLAWFVNIGWNAALSSLSNDLVDLDELSLVHPDHGVGKADQAYAREPNGEGVALVLAMLSLSRPTFLASLLLTSLLVHAAITAASHLGLQESGILCDLLLVDHADRAHDFSVFNDGMDNNA